VTEVFTLLAIFLCLLIAVSFYRVVVGPTIYDRLLGVGAIGTYAVLLLALFGFIFGRVSGFLDLAITYAILNFIGVVAVAKYLDLDTDEKRMAEKATAREGGVDSAPGGSPPMGDKAP